MKISFHGAAKTVTGSKHLITTLNEKKILLDCGMFQGLGKMTFEMNEHFGFDPMDIDFLILSHAHIDHSGLIPKLVKEGFKGKIYCSLATYDLCKVMLADSAHIQMADARFVNKIKEKQGKKFIKPLYDLEDVESAMILFETCNFNEKVVIDDEISFTLIDNGHILGSAAVHLELNEDGMRTRLTFTGDIGRYSTQLLQDPKSFPQSDVIICESTYGDRKHDNIDNAAQQVLDAIVETCVEKRGRLIIPAFSLGRTQELVYTLNKLNLFGLLPNVKIYVDSPLSVNATDIVRKHKNLLNEQVQEFCETRPDPFGFDQIRYIQSKEESMALNDVDRPCVIISASGMAEAGRVKHHIKYAIGNPDNTILIVGYAEPNSLAGRLRSGEIEVSIFGSPYKVKADVKIVDSYSAHADYEEMLQYLSCQDASKVKEMILVHGEPESIKAWKNHLHGRGFRSIHIPELHETIRFL
jgi:metallo-beta-lactamase family protein